MITIRMNIHGQSFQDYFVLKCLNFKKSGIFVELGSEDPVKNNNSYGLETEYNWTGLMVEYYESFLADYKKYRPNSTHIIKDACLIDFNEEFHKLQFPTNIDYLQIDLIVQNRSPLTVLENLNNTVFDNYKFAVITYEHDYWVGNYFDIRAKSRKIFDQRGYIRVFSDVKNGGNPYEDWYVHPDLVDMSFINKIITDKSLEDHEILTILKNN